MMEYIFTTCLCIFVVTMYGPCVLLSTRNKTAVKMALVLNIAAAVVLTGWIAYFWATAQVFGQTFCCCISVPIPGMIAAANIIGYLATFRPNKQESK